MANTTSNKRKKAVAATVAAAAILLAGTFAWTSISQQALNEAIVDINPGGRLHDDFNGTNKDVYVENFSSGATGVDIFARIRLDQYMELGPDAGVNVNEGTAGRNITAFIGGDSADKDSWETFIPKGPIEEGKVQAAEHWQWALGNEDDNMPVYLPTFNMNKDSLTADINGTYEGVTPGDIVHYDDYKTYTNGKAYSGDEIYDWDDEDIDEEPIAEDGSNVTTDSSQPRDSYDMYINKAQDHYAAPITYTAQVITMDQWNDLGQPIGEYWVYDTEDGWAYWAKPIAPGETTGLLLDGINMNKTPDENWYYGINVIAEFATKSDIDKFNQSPKGGTSGAADELLRIITGQNDVENSMQELEMWHVDADDWGYVNVALDESFKLTVREDTIPDGVTYDLSDVIFYQNVYDDDQEDWIWKPIDSIAYTFEDDYLTITDPNFDGEYLRVSDKNDVIHGFVDVGYSDDDPSYSNQIYIYNDEWTDTVSGGEWLIFDAEVYDENGDVIATTDEVEFKVEEVTGDAEDEEGGVEAASLEFDDTYMDGNDLFVASNILETDVTALIVTASYGEDYVDTYRLDVTGRVNPLTLSMSIGGQNINAYPGSNGGLYQLFEPRPAANTYDFDASLDGTTAPVTWSIGEDQDEFFAVSEPDEDGYIYAVATEATDSRWKPIAAGTKIAKINQATGEFNILLEDDLYPLSLDFDIVATMEDGTINSTSLFIRRTEVNIHLNDANNSDEASNYSGVYTAGEDTTLILEAEVIALTEDGKEITYKGADVADKLTNWKLYWSDEMYAPEIGTLMEDGYKITNNGDGTWTLKIDSNVNYDYMTLVAEYQHWRPVPGGGELVESKGLFHPEFHIVESELAERNTGDVTDMTIVNEYGEETSTYVPGERSKIKLCALAYDESGEEIYPNGTMQWYMEDGDGNTQISNASLVTNGFEASVWILGDSADVIKVTGIYYADDGDGSAEMIKNFYIYKQGEEPEKSEE